MTENERGASFVRLDPEDAKALAAEARSWLDARSPCCGYDCQQCPPQDRVADAVNAGITAGLLFAMKRISYQIRAELVCCTDEDIERQYRQLKALGCGDERTLEGFHAICYWGEMGARLAEDGHSLMRSPYGCGGRHSGPCPGTRRCDREQHLICDKCHTCTVCEDHGICEPL